MSLNSSEQFLIDLFEIQLGFLLTDSKPHQKSLENRKKSMKKSKISPNFQKPPLISQKIQKTHGKFIPFPHSNSPKP